MNKEKCFKCGKEITLVDSAYHEGMCDDCYWEYEYYSEDVEVKKTVEIIPLFKANIGDIIYTTDMNDNYFAFVIERIEDKTEGGSVEYGRVFYDKNNNFITEKAIAKVGGIFGKTENRKGFAIRVQEA